MQDARTLLAVCCGIPELWNHVAHGRRGPASGISLDLARWDMDMSDEGFAATQLLHLVDR
jgi:hypothetical protein